MLSKDASTLSLTVLKNLIENLTTQQLADLPVETLPDHIPVSLLEPLDSRKRRVLEDKLLEHQAYVLKVRDVIRRELGVAGLNAYDLAQQDFSTAHIDRFNDRFKEYQAHKKLFDFDTVPDGAQRLLAMLARDAQSASDMQHDFLELRRARKALSNAALPDESQRRVDRANGRLADLIKRHEIHLGQYYTERLALTVKHMAALNRSIESLSPQWKKTRSQLDAIAPTNKDDTRLLSATLRSGGGESGEDRLPRTLKELVLAHELPYAESDLTDWMDIMLDYFQHCYAGIEQDLLFAKSRKYLMHLMNVYFENNALASHHYLQSLPEERLADAMQEYHERSRDYVERYFKERAGDLMEQVRDPLFH